MPIPSMNLNDSHIESPFIRQFYKGKVRDVYFLTNGKLLIHASDRISAFDVILPKTIPGKGALLNSLAAYFLNHCKDICPVWLESLPESDVSLGKACVPIPIEMVVRGHLAGHALRTYQTGERNLCGIALPDGLMPYQAFPSPIITPTTKAKEGHDQDISADDILRQGILTPHQWTHISNISLQLFQRGQEMAMKQGLILMDTKYEFGWYEDTLMLMDEIHTPDSSRYAYADDLIPGKPPRQLSKEFVREWLIQEGFQGKEGQVIPEMTDTVVQEIFNRYAELYTALTGEMPPNCSSISAQELKKTIEILGQ